MRLLLALCLLASPAYSQQDIVGADFRDFSGGLIDSVDPTNLQPNQSPNLQNVVIDDPYGSFKPRNGYLQCGVTPSGSRATNLYTYSKSDGSSKLIVTDNTNVWQTADCITFSTITTAGTAGFIPQFAIVRNDLWIVNGSTFPIVWDGTTAKLLDAGPSEPNPAPPKARYPVFWKERVWLGRDAAGPSSVYYSDLTDSAGNDITPSTGSLAWPAINEFNIDEDGGSGLYGLFAYRDRLYACKDNGVWEIQFNNNFDNAIRKTAASVGCRFNTAIKEHDGLIHFVGPDGVYAFDGESTVRISDGFSNRFGEFVQPLVNQVSTLWDTQSDFEATTIDGITTTLSPGSVKTGALLDSFSDGDFTANPVWTEYGTTGKFAVSGNQLVWTGPCCSAQSWDTKLYTNHFASTGTWKFTINSTGEVVGDHYFYFLGSDSNTATMSGYRLYIDHEATNSPIYLHRMAAGTATQLSSRTLSNADLPATLITTRTVAGQFTVVRGTETMLSAVDTTYSHGNYTILRHVTDTGSGPAFLANPPVIKWDDFNYSQVRSTITSQIVDAVSVSTWGAFVVDVDNNGADISYQIRIGSNTGAVQSAAWSDITSGSLIPSTTWQTLVQWRAFFVSNGTGLTRTVDKVEIFYNQAGANSAVIYAASFGNRFFVSASTADANSYNDIVMVKSKGQSNAWVPYDLKIGAMTRFNDNFYAASSTGSALFRLDYGANDNGNAINWYVETRDENWGLPYNKKNLLETNTSFRRGTAENLKLGYSDDSGATWTDTTIGASGSGIGTGQVFVNGDPSSTYRLRVSNSTRDETATVTGITGWARPLKRRE